MLELVLSLLKSLPLKSNQLPPVRSVRSDFHETLQRVSTGEYLQAYREFFDIYFESKNMVDFHVLQCKLEPPTVNKQVSG